MTYSGSRALYSKEVSYLVSFANLRPSTPFLVHGDIYIRDLYQGRRDVVFEALMFVSGEGVRDRRGKVQGSDK
jgi:hypothetical protein